MAGAKMPLSVAKQMVADYNKNCGIDAVHSFLIDAEYLKNIMAQPDCQYVRFFLGVVTSGLPIPDIGLLQGQSLVIVGADSNKKNITKGENDSEVYEDLESCPFKCNGDDSYIL